MRHLAASSTNPYMVITQSRPLLTSRTLYTAAQLIGKRF
jgi:hypothetical protein